MKHQVDDHNVKAANREYSVVGQCTIGFLLHALVELFVLAFEAFPIESLSVPK